MGLPRAERPPRRSRFPADLSRHSREVAGRENHDNPTGALKMSRQGAEDIEVTTRTPAKKAAKPKPPTKSAAKTVTKTATKTAAKRATPKLPQQRTKRAAAPAAVSTPVKPRVP